MPSFATVLQPLVDTRPGDSGSTLEADGHPRYALQTLLGEGGSGRVYAAFDVRVQRTLALKLLKTVDADQIYRLKREFRSLLDIVHPNLVQLHDLVVGEDRAYFTMELISGRDVLAWIWDGPRPSAQNGLAPESKARLRSAFGQIASALYTLHARGKLHRDIKPSNIVVDAEGRAVLVDLGLSTNYARNRDKESMEGQIVGTFQYMSPEQATARLLTPASDWYSFGVMLYEALVGLLPLDTFGLEQIFARRRTVEPQLSFPEGTPADLMELARGLLQHNPADRPTASDVLRCLPISTISQSPALEPVRADIFVGREQELEVLRSCLEETRSGETRVVRVFGTSGIGKSALVEQFAAQTEDAGALVLRSRCHYREQIPYKALDGVIDDLSRFLAHSSESELSELVPERLEELLLTFPTLRRVPVLAELVALRPNADSSALRHVAFLTLRKLLQRIAKVRPLLLWIDDLQWADHDSVVLLRTLCLAQQSSGFMLVLSYRSAEAASNHALLALLSDLQRTQGPELGIEPLDTQRAHALVRELLPEAPPLQQQDIAQAGSGDPLVTRVLCRESGSGGAAPITPYGSQAELITQLIRARIQLLPAPARRLFDVVCVAGFPLDEQQLTRIIAPRDTRGAIAHLLHRGLIRYVLERGRTRIDVAHDRLREENMAALSTDEKAELEHEIGPTLGSQDDNDPYPAIEYLIQSGKPKEAARIAIDAAERAYARGAYDLASGLLKRFLELGAPGRDVTEIRTLLGEALCEAGRGPEGAHELVLASEELRGSSGPELEVARLQMWAAAHLVTSGGFDQGVLVMNRALSVVRAPLARSAGRAIVWAVLNYPRMWFAKWRWQRRGSPLTRATSGTSKLDVLWWAGVSVSLLDPMRAIQFLVRHGILAYKRADPAHIALSMSAGSVALAMSGGPRNWHRSLELLSEAERLASLAEDPYAAGFAKVQSAVLAHFMGRWQDAERHAIEAERLCERKRLHMASQLSLARHVGLIARTYLGRIIEVRSRIPDLLVEADALGDRNSMSYLRLGWFNLIWLCSDDIAEADRHVRLGTECLSSESYTSLHWMESIAAAHLDLYRGSPVRALQRLQGSWGALKASMQLRIGVVKHEMFELRARCAVASSCVEPVNKAKYLRDARASARALVSSPLPFAAATAALLSGCIAHVEGNDGVAADDLQRAMSHFRRLGMEMHAAGCAFQLGSVLGGTRGNGFRLQAEAWFSEQEIVRPDKVAWLLVPIGPPPGR
jgi:eukaryotic-like serine/threonine-protein kinase